MIIITATLLSKPDWNQPAPRGTGGQFSPFDSKKTKTKTFFCFKIGIWVYVGDH